MSAPPVLRLTAADEDWLRSMDRAMQPVAPVPMVSAERYQAVVESRDLVVRTIHVVLANRRRMWGRYRRLRGRLFKTQLAALVIVGVVIIWKW